MPELPEVETTCRGVAPHLVGSGIQRAIVRQRHMRANLFPQALKKSPAGA